MSQGEWKGDPSDHMPVVYMLDGKVRGIVYQVMTAPQCVSSVWVPWAWKSDGTKLLKWSQKTKEEAMQVVEEVADNDR